jgi:DeoR family suf operon transcriptional repressor
MQDITYSKDGHPPRAPGGTKDDILKLLVKQELSAQTLAEHLHVSPAAVRQHLDTLKALGLVSRRTRVTRPSRPTYLYRLTPHGHRVFPKRHDLLLAQIVEVLVERHGPAAVAEVLEAAAARLAAQVRDRVEHPDRRMRWTRLLAWLEEELAWQANVADQPGGSRRITVHHCPFQEVAAAHPAVCGVFVTALLRALAGDAQVEHTVLPDGPACCALVVSPQRGARRIR